MPLNFPSSPSDGQIYTDSATGLKYRYSSSTTAWSRAATIVRDPITVIIANTSMNINAYCYYVTTAVVDLTLPDSPRTGQWIQINNPTGNTTSRVLRNGKKIMSLTEDLTIDTPNTGFVMTYSDDNVGWAVF